MEDDTVHDTEELQNNTNNKFTNVISENKQDDEVIYENIYFDAFEYTET